MKSVRLISVSLVVLAGLVSVAAAGAQAQDLFNPELLRAFTYRNVGPWRMEARASCIAVPAAPADHLYTFYLATWTGGVFKTTNNGVDLQARVRRSEQDYDRGRRRGPVEFARSSGSGRETSAAPAARTPETASTSLWMPAKPGRTWACAIRHHISRVVIHPTNPEIVYVGAMGHLYSRERREGRLQDDGRRQDLEKSPVRERQDRSDRSGHESPESGHSLRRHVRHAADALEQRQRRSRKRRFTRPLTAEERGRSSPAGCRRDGSARSASTSIPRIPRSSTPSLINCNPGPKPGHGQGMHGRTAGRVGRRRALSHRGRRARPGPR